MTTTVADGLREAGVIAVIRADSAQDAIDVAEALLEGGITGIEITFTTPDAPRAIATLAHHHGDCILLAAGTVTSVEQASQAANAGAHCLVSPGFDPGLIEELQTIGPQVLPGVLTPSEVMAASRAGLSTLKLFPGSLAGPAYLRSLSGPFPDIDFVPTGGVSLDDLDAWLTAGALAVGVGGRLAPPRIRDPNHRTAVIDHARLFAARVDALRT
jgi:2-dehydro-3-deoxyphosphogluconate aldolase/(4S)-4-hydroxy-2-oxoglutarate aldolase